MARRGAFLWLALTSTLGCVSVEDQFVYHPARSLVQDYKPPPSPLQDVELRLDDGTKIHARWCPHLNARGAVLFCHGNAGNLEGWTGAAYPLWKVLGESVLVFDYPGYGYSGGKPSEAGCYAAAEAAYHWLTEARHIAPENIVIYGESLGGGVATELASRHQHRALVLVRTFTSVPDVAQAHLSFLPIKALMKNRFDSLARIGQCQGPVFIAQGDRDCLVPFGQAEQLRAACRGRAEIFPLKGLDHNDLLPPEFYTRLKEFVQEQALTSSRPASDTPALQSLDRGYPPPPARD
jgi:fermentation-respiration switch protein FrsA (DUF1100 family)